MSALIILRRRKRDSAANIYRSCIRTGNCPPDVKNKIENNTLADKILKYASGVVYFGSLGIGTGAGKPIRIGAGGAGTFRPTGPIDAIGPSDIIPIDAIAPVDPLIPDPVEPGLVGPTDPSIIEPIDVVIGDIPDISTPRELIPPPRIPEVYEEDSFTPDVAVTGGGETEDLGPRVVPQPPATAGRPGVVSTTQFSNPSFEVTIPTDSAVGEFSTTDSIVVFGGGGEHVGEMIPMVEFLRPEPGPRGFEETEFITSTPEPEPAVRPRVRGRGRGGRRRPALTNRRRYEQVAVADPAFLSRPASLVTFENPAFEDDVTLIFERDVDEVLQAPHEDFRDVVRLGRPEMTRLPSGRLRVSRLGERATISTRSGAVIGARTHFFRDLSSIADEESIPLTVFGEQSGQGAISQPLAETGFSSESIVLADPDLEVIRVDDPSGPVPDEDLIDEFEDVASNAHLIVTEEEDFMGEGTIDIVPQFMRPPFLYPDIASTGGIHVAYPERNHGAPPVYPIGPPHVILDRWSSDYYLHPSLCRRKRRRRKQIVVCY